jgi:mono/diheme cytochrome c family protein
MIAVCVFTLLTGTGCELRQRMYNQPRYEPYEQSDFFGDQRSARPLIPGTVARGHLNEDDHLYLGMIGDQFVDTFPFPVDRAVLERGQSRFNIYCAPCHGPQGDGNGMIALRGYKKPPTYHDDRLRNQPVGYFYDVITRGFGVMPSYAYQVNPVDRWAVVAYVRALQLSQNATVDDAPEEIKAKLLAEKP